MKPTSVTLFTLTITGRLPKRLRQNIKAWGAFCGV